MRYRSTVAAAALFCAQSAFAFDASTLDFEQQAYNYSSNYGFDTLALNQAQTQPQDNALRFNEAPAHRLPKYLSTAPEKDWDYLMGQTYTILGLSVATVGLMTLLPESVTNWTAEDRDFSNLSSKWWDNVSAGPVWDQDDHYLNYVMHPYFGGVYYTAARHSGFNEFESFLYSFTMSTFFWEYGVESFAEVPSIQDIIVTPLFGAAVGEWMYLTEQDIVANGGEVMGSDTMGGVSLFFLNPVGHIHHWITDMWQGDTDVRMNYDPWFNNQEAARYAADAGAPYDSQFISMQVSLKF
ncbi:ubiquitin-protein ligase [Enterovibrio norvegicus FF-33]|uniref:Ubiquitin-protein ligase n=1 Tax=Enterovibrio norvegicus FF-454 TaxID=1185651 RepID=A0A1E5C2H0_9GAMM|nr:DUF3943 domain-containing protein [Enterovibrio norvegicus]OEE59706.1 ubiquitin-protein ligase [Enterovibrio norvegicus FF-454]OEE70202.1 ubiquitin-protein ligase [Enterovibrio norvegicus FF-33]OEE87446.1 ubiquitin-protein ligase [Enterovibrio norvegicus FF-162]